MQKRQRDIDAKMRLRQQKQEAAGQAMEAEETKKLQRQLNEREKVERCEMLEMSRTQHEVTAIQKRNSAALEEITNRREQDETEKKEQEKAKERIKEQKWREQKVGAKYRATLKAQVAELNELRDENIEIRDDMRVKRQQDEKWMKEREETRQVETEVEDEEALRIRFEAEERDKRRQGREMNLLEEEKKTATIFDSSEKLRNQREAELVRNAKEKEYAHRAEVERRRMEKERKAQKEAEEERNRIAKREMDFINGEKIRNVKEAQKMAVRHAVRMAAIQALPIGTGLSLSFLPF